MNSRRVILCVVAIVSIAACAAPQNLLQNPGFEEVDEAGEPLAWGHGGASELITDAQIARTGQRAAKARFDDGFYQQMPIEAGGSYRVTGYIRRVDPQGTEVPKIKIYFITADGGRASVEAALFEGVTADEYAYWETIVRAPDSAATMNLTLRALFNGSEWFYYDDLTVEQVKAPDWPAWEKTPDLNGVTVTVPDLADVWTDALLRVPPGSLVPMDGLLDTSVASRGHDLVIELGRAYALNYALVHAMRPMQNLGEAEFASLAPTDGRVFLKTTAQESLLTSERFEPLEVSKFRINIPDDANVYVSELQVFALNEGAASPPGQPVTMSLVTGEAPEAMGEHLELAYGREEDRSVYLGKWGQSSRPGGMTVPASPTVAVPLPQMRYANLLAAPADGAYGVSAVSLKVSVASDEPENMLEICLKQAAELDLDIRHATAHDRGPQVLAQARAEWAHPRQYANISRMLTQIGEGERTLTTTFDIPDTLFAEGEPIWLTLRAKEDMRLDVTGSQVTAYLVPPEQAHPEYVVRLERLLRRMYSSASEAHAYGGRDYKRMYLGQYVARVLELDPDNRPATLIFNRIAFRKTDVELTRPGPAEAPEWAVWARLALRNRHDIITWWLDNRQQADGQLAGHINDDGEFSCNWPSHYLMTGDERVKEGLRLLAEVAWRMSGGKGYTVGSRDVEHAAEDQSCTQPQLTIVDYGNPKHVERMMVMSQYLDFWTAINEVGRRQFKSYMFTADKIWDEPPFDIDQPYCPLSMVGTGHLVWYTRSPEIERIFLEEAEAWALGCLSTDKGKAEGTIPKEILFRNSEINPYAPYPSNPILQKRGSLYRGGAGAYIIRYFIRGAFALTNADPWARVVQLWEASDEDKIARAETALTVFTEQIVPPPPGPEKRFTVPAGNPTALEEPFKAVRDGEAIGSAAAEAGGAATYTLNVPEGGRYGVCALLGRTDPTEEGELAMTFFVTVDGGADDRLRARGMADEWVAVTSARSYQLAAGEHTLALRARTAGSAIKEIGLTTRYSLDGTWRPSQNETQLYEAWQVTRDKKWLVEELKECVRQQERNRWLLTEGEPYTDRVPVPGQTLLARVYLGGWTSGKSHVPGHWVSWEGGGTDFAALVLDATPEHLKALVYSFADEPREMKMRAWRLPHGRYSVTVGVDKDGDDEVDQVLSKGEHELARYDAVEFAAPPAKTVVLELTLLEELDDVTTRADLAIGPDDVSEAEGGVTVIVHNIGAAPAPATKVHVQDAAGKVLGEAEVPALEAPVDLKPRTAQVTVKLAGTPAAGSRVVVDPADAVKEITEVNNVAAVEG